MNEIPINNDYKIQIDAIVDDSLKILKKRFPKNQTTEDYTVILRPFSPVIDIQLRKKELDIIVDKAIDAVVVEEFGYESPQETASDIKLNGKEVDYSKEMDFLKDLKDIGFSRFVKEELNTEKITRLVNPIFEKKKQQNKDFKLNYIDCAFLHWINNDCMVNEFVERMKIEQPKIFSYFNQEQTVEQLTSILNHTFERRIRAGEIKKFIHENHSKYSPFFDSAIKTKIYAITEWFDNKSKDWHEKDFCKNYLTPMSCPIFAKPRGIQNIIVAEIVPKGLDHYYGEIGGKTVKVGSFEDLEVEFKRTQGFEKLYLHPELLQKVRDSFLKMCVARRYVTREIINELIDYEQAHTGVPLEKYSEDSNFREFIYRSFFQKSEEMLQKMYRTHNLKQ
ncbi:MAG: hypothetical protein ABIC91_08840 [Nanoarchaeota archaeon]|nr:hypothetical protein [Nanoarchaeota archaeon]MBU1029802.1 hypothetical protein [Nanoarchaeota archaeon]MBU1850047.1 hypothetical protein [Nanoarchaeota archaeon]